MRHGTFEADLELAHELADTAREVSMARFRGPLRRRRKLDGSLVTDADEAVEDALRARLTADRPEDAVLGEERGETGRSARRWILDGIDGTVSFADGSPEWGTLIALEVDGTIVVGVCDAPAKGQRHWASRGRGAFWSRGGRRPERLRVSDCEDLGRARSFIPPPEWQPDATAASAARALTAATAPQPAQDHPALQVAAGGCDLAVFFRAGPWDLAAPALIVEESGGVFTDVAGNVSIASGTAVFTNGRLHGAALDLLTAVGPSR